MRRTKKIKVENESIMEGLTKKGERPKKDKGQSDQEQLEVAKPRTQATKEFGTTL